jgi:NADPH2:quinone reductase
MRAVVINRHGGPEVLEVEELPPPEPGPGELLVEVGAAGINFRDVYEREGRIPNEPPLVAGVEGAGRVVAVGEGASGVSAGDRVGWVSSQGSYAEQVLVPAERAIPVPDDVSDELAAAAMLQGITAHYLVTSAAPVGEGEWALVQAAAGGVGLLLVQVAKLHGAAVVGTTSSDAKAELARAAGADHVLPYDGLAERVRELTEGGVAVAYDGIGRATFDESLASLRPRGTLVLFGMASGPPEPFDVFRLFGDALALRMTSMFRYVETRDELLQRASDVFAWIRDGKLDVSYTTYPLEQAGHAQAELEARRTTGKLVLDPRQ